ncbi:MAG: 2-amino-4-hydroxy-6-hydroxymethyldihydropteridine diphosphokinase [Sulfobacillus acidophilus]|uniref:2-amino-4-hydroxy-6-hydroxymethyldihydropteridine diphosphokinase n=1 Tax=Sulfobacillus acidophilus TaxID=53633 RepID=A0A2T2WGE0_9FIRM|nr:MAG: 2-amino-4-hydroxy-6-hydroxymethyldihydropteridine diphosphokinase [Sulfobacillus acidophilus]
MANRVFVGLGSNLGDPAATVVTAAAQVATLGFGSRLSPLYRTEPQGGPAQSAFCNAVLVFETSWTATGLMVALQRIEQRFGRSRRIHWGPRTLDLDLLLFGDYVIKNALLTLPHPRMRDRRFVLEPLSELAPDLSMPDGQPILRLLEKTRHQKVERWT